MNRIVLICIHCSSELAQFCETCRNSIRIVFAWRVIVSCTSCVVAHAPWKFGGETPVVCVGEMDICHGDILPGDTTYDIMGYWYPWNMGFNKWKRVNSNWIILRKFEKMHFTAQTSKDRFQMSLDWRLLCATSIHFQHLPPKSDPY